MSSWPLFQVNFTLTRFRVANFADMIKIATFFVRATFENSNEVKRNRNYGLKYNLYLCFLM